MSKKDTISAITFDVVNIFEKLFHHGSRWKEYMFLDTHHCSGGKLEFSSFIREMGLKKVEKGIGRSVWNYFFSFDPAFLCPKATRNHR